MPAPFAALGAVVTSELGFDVASLLEFFPPLQAPSAATRVRHNSILGNDT
jgi:hypothetical protein